MFWLLFGSELATKGKEMAAKKDSSIQIIEINTQVAEVCIVGTTPMVQNCMSQKAKMQLLLPPKRKTAAVKATIRCAALMVPGTSKAEIGRSVFVHGETIPVYGVPQLFMSVTRNSDINRTPDVRTRAILPQWAMRFKVRFLVPLLSQDAIANLIAAAGIVMGIGDWRPEKGSGDYGSF